MGGVQATRRLSYSGAETRRNLTVISEHKVEILVCTHVSFLLVTMPTCGVISPMSPLSACWS